MIKQRQIKIFYYAEGIGNLELEHHQLADMIQMEGRFLREDEQPKTIYQTHSVNLKLYPNRTYNSWAEMFEKEFHTVITRNEFLEQKEGRDKQILEWVFNQAEGRKFSTKELATAIEMKDQSNLRNKYLNPMLVKRYVQSITEKWIKYFSLTEWLKKLETR